MIGIKLFKCTLDTKFSIFIQNTRSYTYIPQNNYFMTLFFDITIYYTTADKVSCGHKDLPVEDAISRASIIRL